MRRRHLQAPRSQRVCADLLGLFDGRRPDSRSSAALLSRQGSGAGCRHKHGGRFCGRTCCCTRGRGLQTRPGRLAARAATKRILPRNLKRSIGTFPRLGLHQVCLSMRRLPRRIRRQFPFAAGATRMLFAGLHSHSPRDALVHDTLPHSVWRVTGDNVPSLTAFDREVHPHELNRRTSSIDVAEA